MFWVMFIKSFVLNKIVPKIEQWCIKLYSHDANCKVNHVFVVRLLIVACVGEKNHTN